MKKIKLLLLFITLFLLGCSSAPLTVPVVIDSYNSPGVFMEKLYFLESIKREGTILSLEEQNFAMEIDLMLYRKGFKKTFEKDKANYIVQFDYSIEGPFNKESVVTRPIRGSIGFGVGFGRYNSGFSHYGSVFQPDIFGVVDTIEIEQYYEKKLVLLAKDKTGRAVWEVIGINRDETSSLRNIFPYLVQGVGEYIEKNSEKTLVVRVPEIKQ